MPGGYSLRLWKEHRPESPTLCVSLLAACLQVSFAFDVHSCMDPGP